MIDKFSALFNEMIDNGISLTSALFPYAPTLANRRRDRARAKISEMLTKIVRSRKSSNQVEKDALQNLIDSR
jgi:sterol 14alpha-demethylase